MNVPPSILDARCWTAEAVERLGLGWDGERVTIPVHDQSGAQIGTLRYSPTGAEPKMLAGAGATRELFPPPEMIDDDEASGVVWLVEGEPDCVRAWSAGVAAVAVPGVKGWRSEWAARFRGPGWQIRVCFDADDEGRASAAAVAADLVVVGVDARLVELAPTSDGAKGYDITDLLAGRDPLAARAVLDALAEGAALVHVEPALALEPGDPTVTLPEFVERRDETAAAPLIEAEQGNLLPAGGCAILAAKTGDGKTTIVVELVLHAAAALDYLGLRFPRPLRVLIVENEGPREAFREKLERRLADWPHDATNVRVWDEPATWGAIRASDPELRERLRAVIEGHAIDLVVADTLTRFGVRGNGTPEETREFIEWLNELGLGRDVAFLLLHHPRTRPESGETELEKVAAPGRPMPT